MPGFAKSPPELVTRFDAVAAEFPDVAKRLTFGYPCLYGSGWFVRLAAAETAEALAIDGAAPFEPMPGRPMTGYTLLPHAVIDDDEAIRLWVERAIDFGATLPPKTPKPKPNARSG